MIVFFILKKIKMSNEKILKTQYTDFQFMILYSRKTSVLSIIHEIEEREKHENPFLGFSGSDWNAEIFKFNDYKKKWL